MARINFEDDVEAQDEFWKLLSISGGNRDIALGRLLRFFRLAQKAWGYENSMSSTELLEKGFEDMIQSGWAVRVKDGGYHALGAEKHFDWYRQRVRSAVAGGRARSAAPRDGRGRLLPDSSRNQPEPAGLQPDSSPLALALALAPSLSQKKGNKSASSACALPHLANLWNKNRGTLPEIKGCSGTRRKHSEARWREKPETEYWSEVIARIASSRFCQGENDRMWRADFDFLIRPETRHKVLEGKYDNRGDVSGAYVDPKILELRRRAEEEERQNAESG